jgi:hypothetical protein
MVERAHAGKSNEWASIRLKDRGHQVCHDHVAAYHPKRSMLLRLIARVVGEKWLLLLRLDGHPLTRPG